MKIRFRAALVAALLLATLTLPGCDLNQTGALTLADCGRQGTEAEQAACRERVYRANEGRTEGSLR